MSDSAPVPVESIAINRRVSKAGTAGAPERDLAAVRLPGKRQAMTSASFRPIVDAVGALEHPSG